MPDFYVEDVSIDVDEFLSACDSNEVKELVQALKNDGYLSDTNDTIGELSIAGEMFDEALDMIGKKRLCLTLEEEEYILQLSKKY